MELSARLFHCARCERQVMVCSDCDRGQHYCSRECSGAARKKSLHAASHRYQSSKRGKHHHADRQRRYRTRLKKVTHQGSPQPPSHDVLPPERKEPEWQRLLSSALEEIRCHFCRRHCSHFLRSGFINRYLPTKPTPTLAWPRGP
jgi:hypothetical protein